MVFIIQQIICQKGGKTTKILKTNQIICMYLKNPQKNLEDD